MQQENKNIRVGNVDEIVLALEGLADNFARSWNDGCERIKPHDLERFIKYTKRIQVSYSLMRDTLQLFQHLEEMDQARTVLPYINQLDDKNNECPRNRKATPEEVEQFKKESKKNEINQRTYGTKK